MRKLRGSLWPMLFALPGALWWAALLTSLFLFLTVPQSYGEPSTLPDSLEKLRQALNAIENGLNQSDPSLSAVSNYFSNERGRLKMESENLESRSKELDSREKDLQKREELSTSLLSEIGSLKDDLEAAHQRAMQWLLYGTAGGMVIGLVIGAALFH